MHNSESPAFVWPAKFVRVVNGDMWQLGKHRLACGDARDPANVRTLLTGRRCFGIELNPDYCALAIARWEQLVDGKAKLISRGAGAG